MISLTDTAKSKFKQKLLERGKGLGIRLYLTETGCSGYTYKIDFADEWRSEDYLKIVDDLYIWVSKDAQQYLNGLQIDYIKEGLNERFSFTNPNENGRCGCGISVTF